ncbi:hypothetical protein ACIBCH_09940 [Amycolatopsis thailandensis]|uniref:hypothetical protein n=1 Tax=Amycolatopsis thailandensis TaxID=589330 RepID=UPI0037B1FEF9
MAATPRYALPYAGITDAPHGPNQEQALAVATETALGTLDDYVHTGIGGEYKSSAAQSMATGATKLNFGATVKTAAGITWNGSNQFTVLSSGIYSIFAYVKVPVGAGNSFGVSVGPGSGYISGDGMYFPENFGSSTTDVNCAGTIWLDAGATISAYVYNNNAAVNTNHAGRPALFRVWKTGA